MKTEVKVFVIRVNEEVVYLEGIQDEYTTVQPFIRKEWDLDEEARDVLNKSKYVVEYEDSYYLGETEAKDITGTHSNLKLSIEEIEVEIN